MKNCRVSIIQPKIKPNKIDYNVNHVLSLVEKAIKVNDSDLIALPENCTTGFKTGLLKNKLYKLIIKNQTANLSELSNFTQKNKIYLCWPSYEIDDRRIYNSVFLFSPQGKLLYTYRKIQLYPPEKNKNGGYITAGNQLKVIKTKIGRIGILTCHDADYPYIHQWLLNQKVEIIIRPAAFRRSKDIWQFSNQFLAFGCNAYVLAVNSIGQDAEKNQYYGQSLIIDPNGKIIVKASNSEQIISQKINKKTFDYNMGGKKVYNHSKDLNKSAYKKFIKLIF